MTIASINHIVLDDKGVAWIEGTRTKVVEIVLDHTAWGMSPLEIHLEYPPLTLAQVHAALACYYDHQPEIDRQISDDGVQVERICAEFGNKPTPGLHKLRENKRTP